MFLIRLLRHPTLIGEILLRDLLPWYFLYDPEFGARAMRRTVTDTVENYLADYLLKNEVERGGEITITKENLGL